MYPSSFARPELEPVEDTAGLWATVEDPDRTEPERVVAAWQLAGARDLERVARRLATVLREPTLWLGCEVIEVLRVIAADLAFGVDARGLLAASPAPLHELLDMHCPVLGPVVELEQLASIAPRLAQVPPWLAPVERREALIVAGRSYIDLGPHTSGWTDDVARRLEGLNDFPWTPMAIAPGEALEVTNYKLEQRVGRVTALGGSLAGVLSHAGPTTYVVDVREDDRGGDHGGGPHFRFYPVGGWLAIRVRG